MHSTKPGMIIPFSSILLIFMLLISSLAMSQHSNETLKMIHSRTSIRHFADKAVNDQQVETLLRAAMAAPSARNVQPWVFYVIKDRQLLKRLADELPSARMLAQAPLAIVVCGDSHLGNPNQEQVLNWVMDCSAATQNLLLAATSIGLGAVWTGVHPYTDRIATLRKALNLPLHIIPLNIIPVGYPDAHPQPKEKWDPAKVVIIKPE